MCKFTKFGQNRVFRTSSQARFHHSMRSLGNGLELVLLSLGIITPDQGANRAKVVLARITPELPICRSAYYRNLAIQI